MKEHRTVTIYEMLQARQKEKKNPYFPPSAIPSALRLVLFEANYAVGLR
jgi:hypothetical protein